MHCYRSTKVANAVRQTSGSKPRWWWGSATDQLFPLAENALYSVWVVKRSD